MTKIFDGWEVVKIISLTYCNPTKFVTMFHKILKKLTYLRSLGRLHFKIYLYDLVYQYSPFRVSIYSDETSLKKTNTSLYRTKLLIKVKWYSDKPIKLNNDKYRKFIVS